MSPNYVLIITSLFFLTNVFCAISTNQYIYAFLSGLLIISSLINHYTYSDLTLNIDLFCVYLFVLYGGYTLYNKASLKHFYKISIIIIIFIFSIVVYNVGKVYNCFCFDKDQCIADCFHGLLHILSSFGHNIIILLD